MFLIHESNIEKLENRVHKLRKRISDIYYKEIGEQFIKIAVENGCEEVQRFVEVEVEGKLIINNWIVLGTFKRIGSDDNGTTLLIHTFCKEYEKQLLNLSKNNSLHCDHCNTNRYRNDVVIIYNKETEEFKQVGKACLSEYLSVDVQDYAAYLQFFTDLNDDMFYSGKTQKEYINTKLFLGLTIESIKRSGFIAKQSFDEEGNLRFNDNNTADRCYKEYSKAEQLHLDIINEVKMWINNTNLDSEYFNNLKVLINSDYVEKKYIYILASAYSSYIKYLEKIEKDKNKFIYADEYVGNVKDKITTEGKITLKGSYDSQFGFVYIYEIVDNANHCFIWKTSKHLADDLKVDEVRNINVTLKGTIKEHSQYKDIKQTILTRCSIAKKI